MTTGDGVELRFVIASLRRRWWVVVAGVMVGALVALVVAGPPRQGFQSTTVVAVLSPDPGQANPDRLVAERIAVMRSTAVLEPVAKRFSMGTDALRSNVEVVQQPATGLVKVVTTDRDPTLARALSQAVAEEYIASERTRIEDRLRGMLKAVDDRLRTVQGELSTAPDPGARALKEKEYGELLAARARVLSDSSTEATTDIVEPASEPQPVPRTRRVRLLYAGIVFGGAVGFATAATWARLSRFVVDDASAAEMMAARYLGRLRVPAASSYREEGPLRWWPTDLVPVNVLAAQAQTMTEPGSPLRVVVIAAQRRAGATAVTLALAQALSRASERVVLVDADNRNPELTDVLVGQRVHHAAAYPQGASTSLEGDDHQRPGDGEDGQPRVADGSDDFWSAEVEGDGEGSIVLVGQAGGVRRELAPALLEKAAAWGDVVVVDAGPLLERALARELCQLADAVVYVIASHKQRADVVRYAALQLAAVSHKVLVVSVSLRSLWPAFE
ncbi:MAG TPA: hypothetical protein VHG90_16430 [Acidimicrobiales bacterium]|nr:hypothetical protein [Acidimicrobiales bacterium]